MMDLLKANRGYNFGAGPSECKKAETKWVSTRSKEKSAGKKAETLRTFLPQKRFECKTVTQANFPSVAWKTSMYVVSPSLFYELLRSVLPFTL